MVDPPNGTYGIVGQWDHELNVQTRNSPIHYHCFNSCNKIHIQLTVPL